MKKLNREAVVKHASRFFLVVMSFMLILSLCSMASTTASVSVTIENPDNLPQDFTFLANPNADLEGGVELSFGQSFVDSDVITVKDGLFDDTPIDLVDGDYIVLLIMVLQEEGYYAGVEFNGEPIVINGSNAYLTSNPTVTVIERNTDGIILDGAMFLVPLPPSPIDSLTSVWTSITNWVISSLNTVQGVFYGAGEEVITPDTTSTDTVVYNGLTYYPISLPFTEDAGVVRFYLNGVEIHEDDLGHSVTTINGQQLYVFSNGGVDILLLNISNNFAYAPVGLEVVITSDGSLTLLGTLAVIGVSISLAFLLTGIIQRFLRLRG